jgi:hypothetical protein
MGLAMADEKPSAKTQEKSAKAETQRVEGVIVRVKPFSIRATAGATIEDEAPAPKDLPAESRYDLTINTAIPWADYVRDQAVAPEKAEKSGNAKPKTKESVAVEGQPAAEPNEQVIHVDPATKIELRYRSSTDESDDGSATVAGAEAAQADPATVTGEESKRIAAKPVKLQADGLRVGQYVIVEYHETPAQLPATKIIVLKPVGGADTSAKDDEKVKPEANAKP